LQYKPRGLYIFNLKRIAYTCKTYVVIHQKSIPCRKHSTGGFVLQEGFRLQGIVHFSLGIPCRKHSTGGFILRGIVHFSFGIACIKHSTGGFYIAGGVYILQGTLFYVGKMQKNLINCRFRCNRRRSTRRWWCWPSGCCAGAAPVSCKNCSITSIPVPIYLSRLVNSSEMVR